MLNIACNKKSKNNGAFYPAQSCATVQELNYKEKTPHSSLQGYNKQGLHTVKSDCTKIKCSPSLPLKYCLIRMRILLKGHKHYTDPVFFMVQKFTQHQILQLLTTNNCDCKSQFSQYPLVIYCVDHPSCSPYGVLRQQGRSKHANVLYCVTLTWWYVFQLLSVAAL